MGDFWRYRASIGLDATTADDVATMPGFCIHSRFVPKSFFHLSLLSYNIKSLYLS